MEGITVVAIILTIDDENANTELEKIGEVLPRIEVYLQNLLNFDIYSLVTR